MSKAPKQTTVPTAAAVALENEIARLKAALDDSRKVSDANFENGQQWRDEAIALRAEVRKLREAAVTENASLRQQLHDLEISYAEMHGYTSALIENESIGRQVTDATPVQTVRRIPVRQFSKTADARA